MAECISCQPPLFDEECSDGTISYPTSWLLSFSLENPNTPMSPLFFTCYTAKSINDQSRWKCVESTHLGAGNCHIYDGDYILNFVSKVGTLYTWDYQHTVYYPNTPDAINCYFLFSLTLTANICRFSNGTLNITAGLRVQFSDPVHIGICYRTTVPSICRSIFNFESTCVTPSNPFSGDDPTRVISSQFPSTIPFSLTSSNTFLNYIESSRASVETTGYKHISKLCRPPQSFTVTPL